MQIKAFLLSVFLAATAANAALNEPCIGAGGAPGVCITTSKCSASHGTSIKGACPKTPAKVQCCTKPKCDNGSTGNCRWKSDCAGSSVSGECPGPSGFKCCESSANGFGGYKAPHFPTVDTSVGACKAVAVNGAKKIVEKFPGRIREIGCTRGCTCNAKSSDHCCGRATDLMCSDAGGTPTTSGKEIAVWVMNNHSSLKVKYVIWGQRIWNPTKDEKPMAWENWRPMSDRHGITENHWDHVHVSYNK